MPLMSDIRRGPDNTGHLAADPQVAAIPFEFLDMLGVPAASKAR